MVGVPKSTGQPARHTFRHQGPRPGNKSRAESTKRGRDSEDHQDKQLTRLNGKPAETGAIVYKFRLFQIGDRSEEKNRHPRTCCHAANPPNMLLSPMGHNPSPSPHDRLAQALTKMLNVGEVGYSISAFAFFLYDVPSRIGHNEALDAAVACLIHVHSTMLYKKLQTCLEDRHEGMSSNTVCAAVLLSLVEALAGPRIDNCYLTHVGGAGRLLEILGPEKCKNAFAKKVLHFTICGSIMTSIYKQEECVLLSKEWRSVAFDKTNSSLDECLWIDVKHALADLSVLQLELNDSRRSAPLPQHALLVKASALKATLTTTLFTLHTSLSSSELATSKST
ncbi:hypothetical protein BU23DRAFT_568325 [Bimuria novae-zelandiae CBS 107.79]|uniref:Uncharacterized protein n=1 Tax=Bimuria novae-zelandiae CBS 107.79 TaxID=1447943 RepID=A0A6A5V847_9PLEO|nr:hypothetical protein BU23DRAFT_568325 [Bimuria novae-zelandiae CBS 107.79]